MDETSGKRSSGTRRDVMAQETSLPILHTKRCYGDSASASWILSSRWKLLMRSQMVLIN
ncbi:hypothetical protein TIFTF001_009680 [Ficus carica]|uniref:Uncharacterized protein n=1 Tax=Ficus carica TaxID=3494 RepID=A0AA88AAU7_FICCA|nr:hypothetical protein TIFTF001_009680 [Ficus carica]